MNEGVPYLELSDDFLTERNYPQDRRHQKTKGWVGFLMHDASVARKKIYLNYPMPL